MDYSNLNGLISQSQAREIIHLSAISTEMGFRQDSAGAFDIAIRGTCHLLEACRSLRPAPRIVVALSSAIYGPEPDHAIAESDPIQPWTLYGASKAMCAQMASVYAGIYGMNIVFGVPFNVIGPGQGPGMILSDWCRQIARIEHGHQPAVLRVGNLSTSRDFVDVRDAADAFLALLSHGTPGQHYNIAGGRPVPIRSVLEILISLARCAVRVEQDPTKMSPQDVPVQFADIHKIADTASWVPSRSLETSIKDTLDSWRDAVGKDGYEHQG